MFKLVPYRKNNLSRTEDIFDDFFHSFLNDDFFPPLSHLDTRFGGFKVDVSDGGDRYLIEADLPGMEKADIKIEYDNKYLTILARRDDAQEIKEDSIIRKERWCVSTAEAFISTTSRQKTSPRHSKAASSKLKSQRNLRSPGVAIRLKSKISGE